MDSPRRTTKSKKEKSNEQAGGCVTFAGTFCQESCSQAIQ